MVCSSGGFQKVGGTGAGNECGVIDIEIDKIRRTSGGGSETL